MAKMEYIVLDLNTATEAQLDAAIACNIRTHSLMCSEISKLRKVAETTKRPIERIITQTSVEEPSEPTVSTVDEDFEDEVDYYYSSVKELTSENVREKIVEALPSRKNYQYRKILLRIQAEILRNIKDIRDYAAAEGISLSSDEEFRNEILLEQTKLRLISERLNAKEEEIAEEEHQQENNLIFVPTTGGNIRVLDEIDHIDHEYYERFNSLFSSIKDGTFRNVKRFSRNSELAGLCEVKEFKTRVIFVRLDRNSYAIISAFIKKSDNDKGYRNMLASRYGDYQDMESGIVANLGNEEFMQLHKTYEAELFRQLAPTQKSQPPVKTKVGE